MAKKKTEPPWPGPVTKPLYRGKPVDNNRIMRDGEPLLMELKKFPNDHALRTQEWSICCDCGLRHMITYEVFRIPEGFFLAARAYRNPRTGRKK